MAASPVGYLIARDGPPPPRGLAYDYVLAGDGLYVAAANRSLEARMRIAPAAVRGLPALSPSVGLRDGRLPQRLWEHIVAVASARPEREVLLAVAAGPGDYEATVVVVGCGGTGGFLAEAVCRLLRGRTARLCLVDPDRVEPHNVAPQAFDPGDAGRFKAQVLAEWLARRGRRRPGGSHRSAGRPGRTPETAHRARGLPPVPA